MATTSLRIREVEFLCETVRTAEGYWTASVASLRVLENAGGGVRMLTGIGDSREAAMTDLQEKLEKHVAPTTAPQSPWDAAFAAFRWVRTGHGVVGQVVRGTLVLLAFAATSIFFFDYSDVSSPATNNLRALRTIFVGGPVTESQGFFDEQFFAQALERVRYRFWASGVSFRNLVTGNREKLIEALKRGTELRLVLLDPDSPLGEDAFLPRISRTARNADIRRTLTGLVGAGGLLSTYGQRDKHQVWASDYAPIVPLVVVDDQIFVSFLVHVDKEAKQSAYRAPYLKFAVDSPMGKLLLDHFRAMVQGGGSRLVYPQG